MGSVASIVPSIIGSVVGRAISGVVGIGKKKRKVPEPKQLMEKMPTTTQPVAQRLASQYGGSTMLTGASGITEEATTSKTLLGG
tara:strand:+ start:624 stop:875 length:252 start_codon:yes stop_codon:yes gene_type:complete